MKKDDNKKETLMSILIEGDEEKIKGFLLRNGKKKSYCPLCFHKEPIIDGENKNERN